MVTAVFTPPAKTALAPDEGTENVTVTPEIGLLDASLTSACRFVANAVFTVAFCGVPATTVMLPGGPLVLVNEKTAGLLTPDTVALTLYEPVVVFAVNTGADALPVESVVAAAVFDPLKLPVAPVVGAVNVTETFGTGLFAPSRTITLNRVAKFVPTCALWPDPSTTLTCAGALGVFVRVNNAGVPTPLTVAGSWYVPAIKFATNTFAVAIPPAFVTAVLPPANVPLGPDEGGVNVTVTAGTTLLNASLTITWRFVGNAVAICVLCGVPAVAVTEAGAPGLFVKANVAGVPTPETVAVTEYDPAVVFAVNAGAVATPLAFVVAFTVERFPVKVPRAPVVGAVNVTVTPDMTLFDASRTVTCRFVEKTVLTCVDCGVPAVAVTLAGAPGVFVRLKLAPVDTPAAVAVIV